MQTIEDRACFLITSSSVALGVTFDFVYLDFRIIAVYRELSPDSRGIGHWPRPARLTAAGLRTASRRMSRLGLDGNVFA